MNFFKEIYLYCSSFYSAKSLQPIFNGPFLNHLLHLESISLFFPSHHTQIFFRDKAGTICGFSKQQRTLPKKEFLKTHSHTIEIYI